MEFQNENGAGVKNGAAKETTANKAQHGVDTKKENGNLPKKEAAAGNGKAETGKENAEASAPVKAETAKTEAVKTEDAKPEPAKAEETKKEEIKAAEPVKEADKTAKPAFNLEATLKAVDTLHRKSIQRINLMSRMKQLETFEVTLTQESDELEDNPYQGCKLIIEDDKKRQFVTVQPGLVRMVAQFIFDACAEKLTELEAGLVFPNA